MIDIIPVPYDTRRGRLWRIDFTFKDAEDIPRRIQKRGYRTRGEAIRDGEAEYALVRSGRKKMKKHDRPGPETRPKPTEHVLLAMVDRWETRQSIKPSTAQTYRRAIRNYLIPTIGPILWQDLAEHHLQELMELTSGLKLPMCLYVLKRAIAESRRAGFPPPDLEIELPRTSRDPRQRYLSVEELDRLCAASSERNAAIWRLLFYTGIRRGELLGLKWSDWNWRGKSPTLTVRRTLSSSERGPVLLSPKSGQVRTIPLCDRAQGALKALCLLRLGRDTPPQAPDPILDTQMLAGLEVPYMPVSTISQALDSACRRAGLERISPHVLRHSFASMLSQSGVPIQAISTLLGHKSLNTTMVYAHLSPEGLRSNVATLDNLTGAQPPRPATSDSESADLREPHVNATF